MKMETLHGYISFDSGAASFPGLLCKDIRQKKVIYDI